MDYNSGLQDTVINYFADLFKSSDTEWRINVVSCISNSISTKDNLNLLMPVEDKKVKKALFNMHPDK